MLAQAQVGGLMDLSVVHHAKHTSITGCIVIVAVNDGNRSAVGHTARQPDKWCRRQQHAESVQRASFFPVIVIDFLLLNVRRVTVRAKPHRHKNAHSCTRKTVMHAHGHTNTVH